MSLGSDAEHDARRDAAWVERALEGDTAAANALVDAYGARILTHLTRLLGNRTEAEDLTQETFIRAFEHLHRFDGRRPFRAWLYTIATNLGRNALRSRGRRERREEAAGMTTPAAPPGLAEQLAEADAATARKRRLATALACLPERDAALVHLHYYEQMPLAEAGAILGLRPNAAKVALHRARKRLRELLTGGMDDLR